MEHHGADGIRAAYLTAAEKQKVTHEEGVGKAYIPEDARSPPPLCPNRPFSMQSSVDKPTDDSRVLRVQHNDWSQRGEQLSPQKSWRAFHVLP